MNFDMEIDNSEHYNIDSTSMEIDIQVKNERPKIAFCFLTYDVIVRDDIWNIFFDGIDINKYTVFIHPKNKPYIFYNFQHYYIKYPVPTKSKTDISIVRATLQLLKESLVQDTSITHFIFLTQSCIPLYNFNTLYKKITDRKMSIISCIQKNKVDRYNALNPNMKRYIHPNLFFKQQPNMMLIREDVERFIKEDYSEYFRTLECPDEHYFVNIIINFFKKKFIMKQITFCNPNLDRTQALEFNNIDNDFLNKVRDLGFLFMRKVNKNSNIDLNFLV
jgi:hypothetical protein